MADDSEVLTFTCPRPLRVKQSISVPFLWEERPGTPKREWAMAKPNPWIIPPSPTRLIVSVPFLWEEKPGKPFASPLPGSSSPELIHSPNPPPNPFLHESELRVFHESSSEGGSTYHEDWYSLSETDGHGSSSGSATRNRSIDASAVELLCPLPPPPAAAGMEFICPLSPPSTSFLDKACRNNRAVSALHGEASPKKSWREDCGLMARRTLTLGELILLSRKLSYRRQPLIPKKKRFSMEFIRESFLACLSLRTTGNPNNVQISSI